MKNIVVLYGGDSCEKDISVITGVQTIANIDTSKYNAYPIFWKDGEFYLPDKYSDINAYANKEYKAGKKVIFVNNELYIVKRNKLKFLAKIDCVLLCTHGGKGENGAIQGYFEVMGIPYTSPDVLASSIGMDKSICKKLCDNLELSILPYIVIDSDVYKYKINFDEIESNLSYPVIVKPSRQGSSIGINICKTRDELKEGLEVAFSYDSKVVIEKALTDFKEINCACIQDMGEIYTSSLEEPIGWQEFLSFEDKYMSGSKNIKMSKSRIFPAILDKDIENQIKAMTQKIYKALGCKGIVRCDYMIDNTDNKVYFNEINTIPGSLANYLFSDKDIKAKKIYSIIIDEAIRQSENVLKAEFSSDVLQYYAKGSLNACKMPAKKI